MSPRSDRVFHVNEPPLNFNSERDNAPLAVRSVYGRRFPWLVTLDKDWAARAADRIFPLAPTEALLFDAAWFTYVSFSAVFSEAAQMLRKQYQKAGERIGEQTRVRVRSLRSPAVALGEHLLTLYGRGEISINDAALTGFFGRANAETRQGTLVFVGRSLMPSREKGRGVDEEQIPAEVVERFREFWDVRGAASTFAEEAAAFGWWFASGRFEDAWAIEQFVHSAKASSEIDGLMFCNERLLRLATAMPARTAEFLYVLVSQHEPRRWVLELDDALRSSLEAILRSGGAAAALATTIINQLGEKQIADYGDLLPK